jgi:hypothetical protein
VRGAGQKPARLTGSASGLTGAGRGGAEMLYGRGRGPRLPGARMARRVGAGARREAAARRGGRNRGSGGRRAGGGGVGVDSCNAPSLSSFPSGIRPCSGNCCAAAAGRRTERRR